MRSGPPPRTRSERRAQVDDAFARDLYLEAKAEEAAIEAEFQATRRQMWDGSCSGCGRDSNYDLCHRCLDEINRERQEQEPAPWFNHGSPP